MFDNRVFILLWLYAWINELHCPEMALSKMSRTEGYRRNQWERASHDMTEMSKKNKRNLLRQVLRDMEM